MQNYRHLMFHTYFSNTEMYFSIVYIQKDKWEQSPDLASRVFYIPFGVWRYEEIGFMDGIPSHWIAFEWNTHVKDMLRTFEEYETMSKKEKAIIDKEIVASGFGEHYNERRMFSQAHSVDIHTMKNYRKIGFMEEPFHKTNQMSDIRKDFT
ncbi:MAG: hypothetical protein EOP45_09860 [Sphingobacteriaceae bacterium]|nr:MAG: hypothetical protein EOP45_09860 [Sphingobacteriaceae bacterium]